jgi:hypothetical protein
MNRASANGGNSRHITAMAFSAYVFFSGGEKNSDRLTGKLALEATSWNSHA